MPSESRRRGRSGRTPPSATDAGDRGAGSNRLTGSHGIREALLARRRKLIRLWWPAAWAGDRGGLLALAEQAGVTIAKLAGDSESAEPELEVGPLPVVELEDLVSPPASGPSILLSLDGVEDPQNLGALARVAESVGVGGIVLTYRRSPPLSPAVTRASAGAIEWLPVARVSNLKRGLEALKAQGYWILGADPEAELDLYGLPERVGLDRMVVVLGAEGRGLRPGVLRALDFRVKIPMQGHVASLNVATAGAVLLFELARRQRAGVRSPEPATPA